jgi:hypothetical protein
LGQIAFAGSPRIASPIRNGVIPPQFFHHGASMDSTLTSLSAFFTLTRKALVPACFFFVAIGFGQAYADEASKLEFFESRIRPVLIEHCYECHSSQSKNLKGGLFVDSAEGLRLGGDSGPAIELGTSDASLLMQALRYESRVEGCASLASCVRRLGPRARKLGQAPCATLLPFSVACVGREGLMLHLLGGLARRVELNLE